MAWNTVITQAHLTSAGIPDATLSASLLGLTVAVAADTLETVMALRAAGQLIDNGGLISYTINGQETSFSTAAVQSALTMLRALKNPGGGPAMMPMRLR